MRLIRQFFKPLVAASIIAATLSTPVWAQSSVDTLMAELAEAPDAQTAARLERQIIEAWSQSGSPSVDLLVRRGRAALEVGDWAEAMRQFRAVTDHAPAFSEGWHGLALAYFNTERFGPAMAALARTLTINPDHFAALRGVGAIHEQVDNPALAYEAYSRVGALRPHDADIESALERLGRTVRGAAL